jgi:diadenosine tetraphosphate (Ap4A) HIT family hydrolase
MPLKAAAGLHAAISDLNDPEEDTDFVVCKYASKNELVLVEDGEGGIDEFAEFMEPDQVMYGLQRSDDGFMRALITWAGPECKVMMRARVNGDRNTIPKLLGNTHFSVEAHDMEQLLSEVKTIKATDSSGHKVFAFTGERKRVGQLEIPEWELDLYRSCWNDVGQLGFPYEADWVREWHNNGHLNHTVFNQKDEVDVQHMKTLSKVRYRINRVPEELIPKPFKRVIRRVCNRHRDGDMQLTEEELDYLVKAIAMFEMMANMATEPEDIELGCDGPQEYFVGDVVTVGPATVTPEDALKGLEFRVEPPLPAGFVFNTEDGSISGTAEEEAPQTVYKIFACNRAGEVFANLQIQVQDGIPPESVAWNADLYTLVGDTVGVDQMPAPCVMPAEAMDKNMVFRVEPALPAGLEINPQDGSISGSATDTASAQEYTIYARNHAGEVSTTFLIDVAADVAPTSISLGVEGPQYLLVDQAADIPAPAISPDKDDHGRFVKNLSFQVEPALPAGLSLNAEDGSISGTPQAETEQADYTITATNRAGSVSAAFPIRVRLADLESAHARSFEERNANYPDTNIFCKIAAGEIPCHKVFEDDHVVAFMDINPAAKGHIVVTCKDLYQSLDVVPAYVLSAMTAVLPKLAVRACEAVGAKDYQIVSNNGSAAGQTIFNSHFHIIPRLENDGLPEISGGSAPSEELAALAEKIFMNSA